MPGQNAKISVVLMTRNEEEKIAACLEAVRWADEIVIVDDYSSDKTVEIARKFTDKIIFHRSLDNHDEQWNIGIKNSACEWILHIDADEIVPPDLKEKIQGILADSKGYSAFSMTRRNYFLGRWMKHGGWTHDHLILFKKAKAECVGQGIHVKLKIEGRIGKLKSYIEHYPFNSIYQFVQRQNHYSSAEASGMLAEHGSGKLKELNYNLAIKPLKLFWKMFIKKGGFREGMIGFIFSSLYAWIHFLKWAKYAQLTRSGE